MAAGGWTSADLPVPPQPGYYDDNTVNSGRDAVNLALERFGPLTGIEYVAVVARY
jgi:hypothetical protein